MYILFKVFDDGDGNPAEIFQGASEDVEKLKNLVPTSSDNVLYLPNQEISWDWRDSREMWVIRETKQEGGVYVVQTK
jgi:hypothetical protein